MRFAVKLIISCLVIAACMWITQRKLPTLSGLISVMPLTGALVLIWAGLDNPGNTGFMLQQCKGALWGILPSILFFVVAFFCLKRQLSLPVVLAASFAVWILGALVHQLLMHK